MNHRAQALHFRNPWRSVARHWLIWALALFCQLLPGRAAEPVYDASEYFAAGENEETGVWSWRGKWEARNNLNRDGNYALLPSDVDVAFPPGTEPGHPGWGMGTPATPGSYLPSVWRFLGPERLESFLLNDISYRARPGVLLAHPGDSRLVSITWRAPRAGVISLAAQFQDAATGDARADSGISWFIQLRREKPLASGNLALGGTTALLQRNGLSVKEGDLLHFAIDPRGSFTNDTTAVLARVSYGPTAAPDPTQALDAPVPPPPSTAALRLLPGGNQTLRYGGGANDFVVLAGGTDVTDWPIVSGGITTNYVASGILAYDQALRYDLSGATVTLKGGTPVQFSYFSSSNPAASGYVASGTLSSTAPAQTLPYGYQAGYSMAFQPGSSLSISLYPALSPGVAAQGFVKRGIAALAQPVYFSYLAGGTLIVKPGTQCDFHHSPTAGTAQAGYLKSGTPNADTYLPYSSKNLR